MEVAVLNQTEKHALVAAYAAPYGVLVETGIWNFGGASTALAGQLETWAIDIQPANIDAVCTKGVRGLLGSSAEVLPRLLRALGRPACFWLDAHYAVESDAFLAANPCPLLAELDAISGWEHGRASTVLVDDMRLMGAPGWPTRAELFACVLEHYASEVPAWRLDEADDILRLLPV